MPEALKLLAVLPHTDGKPCQVRSAQRRRLADNRSSHRLSEDICLELHQKIIRGRAAVNLERGQAATQVLGHRVNQILGLISHGFQGRAYQMIFIRAAGEAEHRAARVWIPIRRAESHKGRHHVDTVCVRHCFCHRFRLR